MAPLAPVFIPRSHAVLLFFFFLVKYLELQTGQVKIVVVVVVLDGILLK